MAETGYIVDLGRMLQQRRLRGDIADVLMLVEHPPTYTIGRSGGAGNLLVDPERLRADGFELVWTDRGGDITYHGPGQLVGYPVVDLRNHGRDVHRYLRDLEGCLIAAAADFGIEAGRRDGLTGVWAGDRKLASIGVRVVRWVTMHGFALNVNNDLGPFDHIVPCGIRGCRVTSVAARLGRPADAAAIGDAVGRAFGDRFDLDMETIDPDFILGDSSRQPAPLRRATAC
jgi:lipoate-protein ligase B